MVLHALIAVNYFVSFFRGLSHTDPLNLSNFAQPTFAFQTFSCLLKSNLALIIMLSVVRDVKELLMHIDGFLKLELS